MTMPAYPADVLERAKKIRLIGFDVDGTLTDGRLFYGTDGHEAKSFQVLDGLGFTLLRHAGIETALVTARISEVVERRGRELQAETPGARRRTELGAQWPVHQARRAPAAAPVQRPQQRGEDRSRPKQKQHPWRAKMHG